MCTLVLSRQPGTAWPLILAANRDELADRPSRPPGRHWPDRAEVVAGLDLEAGGSWLGINDYGVVAGVLNRPGTLGPAAGKRSRDRTTGPVGRAIDRHHGIGVHVLDHDWLREPIEV